MNNLLNRRVVVRVYRGHTYSRKLVGTVIRVRDTHNEPLHWKSYKRKRTSRSRFILTVAYADGTFRSYYHSHVGYRYTVGQIIKNFFSYKVW